MSPRCTRLLTCVLFSILSAGCGSTNENGTPEGVGGAANPDGATLDSGDAATSADVLAEAPCVAQTCAQLGAECGSVADGCGATLDCGTCAGNKTCGGGGQNKCGDSACTPRTCAQVGASCGQISDGCTSVLDCGWCASPESCGGGGVENQCGCTCTLAHGTGECAANGGCAIVSCETGWADCNGSAGDGCETSVSGDLSNCGACGKACALSHATSKCIDGVCAVSACDMDWGDCDLDPSSGCEEDLQTSKLNCGECGLECQGFCMDGTCQCTKPCGVECCTTGQKCCIDAEMCFAISAQCPLPR